MFTSPVMPVRFHHTIPLHMTCQPRRPCRRTVTHGPRPYGPGPHGPPAWLFAPAGGRHQDRDALCLPPFLEDVFGMWKEVAGIPAKKEGKTPPKPEWKDSVNCRGFSPDEISLEISDGKIIVNCNHETNDGAGNIDVRELKRIINVPEDVDGDKIMVTLSTKGLLTVKAPRKPDDKETESDTPAKPEEADMVGHEQRDEDECSCDDCQEDDQGETTGSLVDGKDMQMPTPADNSKTEAPVRPEKKPLEKEQTAHPAMSEKVDKEPENMDTTKVESKPDEEASVGLHQKRKPQGIDSLKKDVEPGTEKFEHPERTRTETIIEEKQETSSVPEQKPETEKLEKPEKRTETHGEEKTETREEHENRLFEIHLDMKNFNPDSIEVKLNGNALTISGKQEDKDKATGKVVSSKAMYRRFYIPDDVNCDQLTSSLDSHGQMTISAPYKTAEDLTEKVIPISMN